MAQSGAGRRPNGCLMVLARVLVRWCAGAASLGGRTSRGRPLCWLAIGWARRSRAQDDDALARLSCALATLLG